MGKSMDTKKDVKKKPAKTMMEKRAAKKPRKKPGASSPTGRQSVRSSSESPKPFRSPSRHSVIPSPTCVVRSPRRFLRGMNESTRPSIARRSPLRVVASIDSARWQSPPSS